MHCWNRPDYLEAQLLSSNRAMKKLLLILLILQYFQSFAQPNRTYTIKDKKAIKVFEEALAAYDLFEYEKALTTIETLVKEKPDFIEAQLMLAQLYDETGATEKAIDPLKKAIAIDERFYPAAWMMLAECYFAQGNYDEAEKAISKFIPLPKNDIKQEKRAQLILSSCIFAKSALQYPVPFDPINLGPGVNTKDNEYYPCITADEKTLLFTRLVDDAQTQGRKQEDFYLSKRDGEKWGDAKPVLEINTTKNEGAPTLSADGQMLIFTACEAADGSWGGTRQGLGSCDLFYSMRTANGWTPAENMGDKVNSNTWESQPSFAANGRTLYFVRGKRTASGIKEQDIYYSYLRENGEWAVPMKVPGRVNTIFEEESVMIHPDGQTLYFSSNGHSGMGGLDIFMSRLLPSGDWDTPVNLGYPINTHKDENSIQVTARGQIALFASDRFGGEGGLDLYQFNLPTRVQPALVTYVAGIISDKLSYKKLEARLELIDLQSGKTITEAYSNKGTGDYLLCLPAGKDYALNVSKDGYLFHSENFSLKNFSGYDPYRLDVQLQKLRPGASIVLNNVFFETNKWELKPESMVELDRLAMLLQSNPEKKIEIGGHTDNVGSDDANLTLSNNRAQSVVDYLIKKGIPTARLSAKGYGETQPIATNDTDAGRAKNRRTEFKVIE
jgi:outer membrane protein OmpA-like peptidoglycan-associated protein/tetratricopeptide (TPR) repeat protein